MDHSLAARIAALSPEQRELFIQALKKKQLSAPIPRLPRTPGQPQSFAVSSAQERLWFLQQLDPDSVLYNIPAAVHCRGPVDLEVLRQSLNELARRHETLRTTLTSADGLLQQVVAPQINLDITVEDLRQMPAAEQAATVQRYLVAEAHRPFALEQGPLVRLSVLLTGAEEHVQLLTLHHTIADAWSAGVLVRELWQVYDALLHGCPQDLAELPVQYADYAAWQRDLIQTGAFQEQLDYWTARLAGELPLLDLPADRPRPPAQSFLGAVERLTLPGELTADLKALAQAEGCTLFMVVLAAFNALLHRYTGQTDLLVGSPISNRGRNEITGLIGCFVNMLVLRNDLSGNPSFRALLGRVRQTALEAYKHQDLPFERLVEVLRPARSTSRSPLFQISFGSVENPLVSLRVPGDTVTITPLETHTGMAKFDLTLEMSDTLDGSILLTAEYSTDLFEAATIQRLLGHLQNLLTGAVAAPERSITLLPLLSDAEWQQLCAWNATETPLAGQPVHRLFEQQVRRCPTATAATITRDLAHIYRALKADKFSPATLDTLSGIYTPSVSAETNGAPAPAQTPDTPAEIDPDFAHCCFRRNPYIHRFHRRVLEHTIETDGALRLNLLRTYAQNLIVVSDNLLDLLDSFDGASSLTALAARLEQPEEVWMGFIIVDNRSDKLKLDQRAFRLDQDFRSWVPLIKALYTSALVDLSAYTRAQADGPPIRPRAVLPDKSFFEENSPIDDSEVSVPLRSDRGPVLLLGETIGTASIGIAYLASFLRRHGISAFCQLNDFSTDHETLRTKVFQLLDQVKPTIVGVSIKWFPHMARGLEICRLVKEYDPAIQVVLGGDSATFFADRFVQYDCVDYVVLGDGEVPFLEICQGAEHIPNCLYKRNGQLARTPVSYLHSPETFERVYLSHLDELFVSKADLSLGPYLFVFTGRGCPMNCYYCGGARDVQVHAFNRPKPYSALRGVAEARHDIIKLKQYTSTFLFDFDTPNFDSLEMYSELWSGIDLTDHFGYFYFWSLPTPEFIDLVTTTFKYVYLNIDLNSLSERHRLHLSQLRFGKPQPRDEEILAFFSSCERYPNVESTINLINGLPHFNEEDIAHGHRLLLRLLDEHHSFVGLGWGRLHAQPGAPLTRDYEKWGMRPSAKTFDDFLEYSQRNMAERQYPDLATLHYPMVYYQDELLNAKVGKYYVDTMRQIKDRLEQRQRKVKHEVAQLSYAELNTRANQLARHLRGLGVRAETRVGIYLERSLDLVLAILAVWKAGGAYIPLDPAYPQERLRFMLQDSGAALLVSQERLAQTLPTEGLPVVCLARDWPQIAAEPSDDLALEVPADQLAYVLYTSGSTGQPKGVMVSHRGIGNLAAVQAAAFAVGSESRVLQFAPSAFDASVSEIAVTLLAGATLCLAPQDALLPGPELVTLLREQAISVVTLPPSVQAALPTTDFPELQTLVSAGEACNPALAARWAEGRRYVNAYGPTEATVCATLTGLDATVSVTPIGGPISNAQVYLLDPQLQPVPVGVPGELYIGGVGLARGYIGRPDLTAERFVPHPFSAQPGQRLYRSGDLGLLRPDGQIEFLGRADHQVKIRGSRVELGEIEAVLLQHPQVREAAVTSWDGYGDRRLVAYLVPRDGQAPGLNELRSFLSARLPDYMLPSSFVTLEQLPLSPNGKVNRGALPAPDQQRPELGESYVAPRSPVEEVLAGIWATCLNVERVGVHDNFFELGGYSLLITQVLARMRDVFQVELPTRTFLDAPTVAGVAQALIQHAATPGQVESIAQLRLRISQMSPEEVRTLLREKKLGRKVTFNGF